MLTWLNTGAFWWLLLVPALILLYLLRPRPNRRVVSSLRLWRELPQISRSTAQWRRPPLSLLLILQALLLLAGAFALMQPALASPGGRHFVVLLDASGSMQAVEGPGSSRFEQAIGEVRSLAAGLAPGDFITLLRVGPDVTTLCSACKAADLESAFGEARPGAGKPNMAAALAVAAGLSRQGEKGAVEAVVISDGAFSPVDQDDLPPSVRFVQVGSGADNRALVAISARRPPDGSPGYTAYARVENMDGSEAAVEVSALADNVPLPERDLTLPAGGHADLTWQVPAGTARLTVSLGPQDALAADNRAILTLPAEGQHKVVVVSDQTQLYSRVLGAIPGLEAVTVQGEGNTGAGLTIIEGAIPDPLPAGSLLIVNPEGTLIPAGEDLQDVRPLASGSDHPLLAGLDLRPLIVRQARGLQPPSWLETVAEAPEGPLLLAGENEGRRIAVLAFDPNDSNLPKLAAFPLLMANLVDWLYPLAGAHALRPGDSLYLAPGSIVTTPGGRSFKVGESGIYGETDEPGLYRVAGTETVTNTAGFAVNMADAEESDLTPRAHPELARQAEVGEDAGLMSRQEIWAPLAALALLLVGAEWLIYCWKRGSM